MAMSRAEISARYRRKDIEAYRKRKREYAKTPEQREKRKLYMRKWTAANREHFNKLCRDSHARIRKTQPPEFRHAQHLKYTYGITRDDYLKMLEKQGGKCLICASNTPRGNKSWHIDHCHETGKIRGLLCNYCNPRLGWYEAYKSKIEGYLSEAQAQTG